MTTILDELKAEGINQQQVATALGLSTAAVSKWKKNGKVPLEWEAKLRVQYRDELAEGMSLDRLIKDARQRDEWAVTIEQETESLVSKVMDGLSGDGQVDSKRTLQLRKGVTAIAGLSRDRPDNTLLSRVTDDLMQAKFSIPLLLNATLTDYANEPEVPAYPQLHLFRSALERCIVVHLWTERFEATFPIERRMQQACDRLKRMAMKVSILSLLQERASTDEGRSELQKTLGIGRGTLAGYLERTEPEVVAATQALTACIYTSELHHLCSDPLALRKLDFEAMNTDLRHYHFPVPASEVTELQFIAPDKRMVLERLDEIVVHLRNAHGHP